MLLIESKSTMSSATTESTKKRKSPPKDKNESSSSSSTASKRNNGDTEKPPATQATKSKSTASNKRKKNNINGSSSSKENGTKSKMDDSSSTSTSFKPYNLHQIEIAISKLSDRIPSVPETGIDPDDKEQVRSWALSMQAIIEEFNLLLTCISAATYKWGSDRTGAADQNLSLLSNELGNAQEQISSSVTSRLTNVLAPVVELVTKETIVKKVKAEATGEEYESRVNTFSREENDPNFIHLCHVILCRNAVMLRHVVLTNFHKVEQCIKDYLKATKKDGNHGSSAFY